MTYSIVARDPSTGDLGVAVQTAMFAVGGLVPSALAGVGAVASQAINDAAYGPRCLASISAGAPADEALQAARRQDPASALRQVGVIDHRGQASAFTGELCIDHAGHVVGEGYAVQANMMASPEVWPAMAGAYESSSGPLAERMLSTLLAAEAAGGDARGRMSAAMLIVQGDVPDHPWDGRVLDVRVDHHDRPLDELQRLIGVAGAFRGFGRGVDALFSGDASGALEALEPSLAALPDEANLRFVRAGALLLAGRTDEARATLRELIAERPSIEVVVRSFATKGLLALPPGTTVDAILAEPAG